MSVEIDARLGLSLLLYLSLFNFRFKIFQILQNVTLICNSRVLERQACVCAPAKHVRSHHPPACLHIFIHI